MVAYSFKRQFIQPISIGLGIFPDGSIDLGGFNCAGKYRFPISNVPKRQTIRAIGKRRHARLGETLQLYTAMRTKQCRKIGDARCTSALPVCLHFVSWGSAIVGSGKVPENCYFDERLHLFAQADGFESWEDMKEFWRTEHPGIQKFEGVLIQWEPL